ncbi:MAG: ABC transporter permease [Chloroflexota bacterium]|nr:ABC transporter permease [Chloroflexota bacterium]
MSTVTVPVPRELDIAPRKSRSEGERIVRAFFRSPAAIFGLLVIVLLVVCALFAEQIAPFGPTEGDFGSARLPPAWEQGGTWTHPLGTDRLGWDLLSRIIYGARVSLLVGFFGALLAGTLGVTLGVLAGYFGGWIDTVISSFVNLILSVPYLVLVVVIATIFGRSLLNVILIFGVTGSPVFVRLVRGEVLRLRALDYVEAARSLGAKPARIIRLHLLPNLIGPLITLATYEMSAMIFYESGLSFLGLSVPPEVPSWGNLLAIAQPLLRTFPWLAIFPGLAIALTALAMHLVGDRLRDVLDPRLRESE